MPQPSESPLRAIKAAYQKALNLSKDDQWAVDFLFSCAVAYRLGRSQEPVWGLLVGPSASGKTEMTRPFLGVPWIYPVDKFNSKSLISGLPAGPGAPEVSLLPLIQGCVVLISDFTTIITSAEEDLRSNMGSLRRAYDRMGLTQGFGTGVKTFDTDFSMLCCSTNVIDSFLQEQSELGERFIRFRIGRIHPQLRDSLARDQHIEESKRGKHRWQAHLANVVRRVMARYDSPFLDVSPPVLQGVHQDRMSCGFFLLARVRTLPGQRGHIKDPERTSRIGQQIPNLVGARIHLDNRREWSDDDVEFGTRVIVDSMPLDSMAILSRLGRASHPVSAAQLAQRTYLKTDWVSTVLRQFGHNGLVRSTDRSHWELTDDTREAYNRSGVENHFPRRLETPEELKHRGKAGQESLAELSKGD